MKRKIESLHGVIEVGRMEEPPPSLFCIIKESVQTGADGVPELRARIKRFVDLDALSPALQASVREEMGRTIKLPKMHPDTEREFEERHAESVAEVLRTNPLPACDLCGESMRVEAETERWRFLIECTNCGHTRVAEYNPSYELVPVEQKEKP